MPRRLFAILSSTLVVFAICACSGGTTSSTESETGNQMLSAAEGYKRVVIEDMSFELPEDVDYEPLDEVKFPHDYTGGNDNIMLTVHVNYDGEYNIDHEGIELGKVGDINVYVWHDVMDFEAGPHYSASIEFNHNGQGHQILISSFDESILNDVFNRVFETLIID